MLSKPCVTPDHPRRADAVAATGLKLDARTIVKLEEPYHPKPVEGTREGPGIRDARRWIERMRYVGGIRDRSSHDAAGHDVLELTVHGLGEAPYPTATLVADVIQKANQSSSGGHSRGGTVIMQPIATQSGSWALRSWIGGSTSWNLSHLIPLCHLTEQVRVRPPQPLICAAGRRDLRAINHIFIQEHRSRRRRA